MAEAPALELTEVTRRFGDRAVVDGLVSLSLQGVAEIRDLQRRALRDAGVDLDTLLAPA